MAATTSIFPHHENERAQAEAAGHPFARHWLHSGMVEIGGEKMSKSLNNFVTLADALDAHGARAFRLAVLQIHYRSQTELGPSELGAAGEAVDRLDALVRRARAAGIEPGAVRRGDGGRVPRPRWTTTSAPRRRRRSSSTRSSGRTSRSTTAMPTPPGRCVATVVELRRCSASRSDRTDAGDDDAEIDALVAARAAARAAKDFAEADRVRDELAARGITLEDTADGTIWHR